MSGTAALAASEPLVLVPSSKWQLDYSQESCKLARTFGEGDQAITMLLTRYSPSPKFSMMLAGERLKGIPARSNMKIRFGDSEDVQKLDYLGGNAGELPALFLASSAQIHKLTDAEEKALKAREEGDPRGELDDLARSLAAADAADHIWLDTPGGKPIRLETGSLGKPFRAFDTCIDNLVKHWGVDMEAYRQRTRDPVPKSSPGRWILPSDYPRDLINNGGQGIVHFRLSIAPNGDVTGCHIQGATEGDGFQKVTCETLTQRGKFVPALDANGQPIASYYASTVRFEIW